MPRTYRVKKSRKDWGVCRRAGCQTEIKVGDPYNWAKPRFRGKLVFCAAHFPKRSELTSSDKLARIYEADDEINDGFPQVGDAENMGELTDALEEVAGRLEEIADDMEDVASEYRESAENIREYFEGSSQADDIEYQGDDVQTWADEIRNAADHIRGLDGFDPEDFDAALEYAVGEVDDQIGSIYCPV